MDVLEVLKADHQRVEALFKQAEKAGDSRQQQSLFAHIYRELTLHAAIEEEVFYPAVRVHADTANLVAQSYEDHDEVRQVMLAMSQLSPEAESYRAHMQRLQALVEAHVREEESELFPKVRDHIDAARLVALATAVEQARSRAKQSLLGMAPQAGA